ncbi:MAG: GNAT family N-acetyltransferase [Rhodobacteraceae bacterium]|nr:GNAT family N-acetyltransferase [Paracoccaceae bacterium]
MRRAEVFDVFGIAEALQRSIRELCVQDHQNDPEKLQDWLANKTPETVRLWLQSPGEIWVVEQQGQIAAVGGISPVEHARGTIRLNYVAPAFRFQGISDRLLAHLEQRLITLGASTLLLEATETARDFYLTRGWMRDDTPPAGTRQQCLAMIKRPSSTPTPS